MAFAQNVKFAVSGTNMFLFVDLSTIVGPSSTGKTTLIATTSGARAVGASNVVDGLNMYLPNGQCVLKRWKTLVDMVVVVVVVIVTVAPACEKKQ